LAKDAVQLYEQSLIIKVRQTFTTSALFNARADRRSKLMCYLGFGDLKKPVTVFFTEVSQCGSVEGTAS